MPPLNNQASAQLPLLRNSCSRALLAYHCLFPVKQCIKYTSADNNQLTLLTLELPPWTSSSAKLLQARIGLFAYRSVVARYDVTVAPWNNQTSGQNAYNHETRAADALLPTGLSFGYFLSRLAIARASRRSITK